MSSRIIFTDPHGCFLTFMALRAKVPQDIPIVIAGDLVDRGPRSCEMVQYCVENNIQVTRGNHEQMMMDFFYQFKELLIGRPVDINGGELFLSNGGSRTLMSYGFKFIPKGFNNYTVLPPDSVVQINEHIQWMANLPIYLEFEDVVDANGRKLVVSHSSINAAWKRRNLDNIHDKMLFEKSVLWNRYVVNGGIKDVPEIYNVFGHTVMSPVRIKVPFAAIDSGCVFSTDQDKDEGYGRLTALQYPEMVIYQQDNIDI